MPTEIKKKQNKPRKKPVKNKSKENLEELYESSENNINSNQQNRKTEKEPDFSYLYTLVNFNGKLYKKKLDKVDNNKKELRRYKRKPISIDGAENIFSSYSENSINIIKLNNHKLYHY